MLYGANMVLQPEATGDPGNAPASYVRWASAAVISPVAFAPIFTVM